MKRQRIKEQGHEPNKDILARLARHASPVCWHLASFLCWLDVYSLRHTQRAYANPTLQPDFKTIIRKELARQGKPEKQVDLLLERMQAPGAGLWISGSFALAALYGFREAWKPNDVDVFGTHGQHDAWDFGTSGILRDRTYDTSVMHVHKIDWGQECPLNWIGLDRGHDVLRFIRQTFDLDICQVAWDGGKRLLITNVAGLWIHRGNSNMSLFIPRTMEFRSHPFDATTQEMIQIHTWERINKYVLRGFHVRVVPSKDPSAIVWLFKAVITDPTGKKHATVLRIPEKHSHRGMVDWDGNFCFDELDNYLWDAFQTLHDRSRREMVADEKKT